MIIDAKTILITLVVAVVAMYLGLRFIRQFALQIAQENHDAVMAMDQADENIRQKKERAADLAAASAYAKVQPILTVTPAKPPQQQKQQTSTMSVPRATSKSPTPPTTTSPAASAVV